MRRKKIWTDEDIAKLPRPVKGQKDYWDHGEGHVIGLGVRIGQGDKRAWIVACRIGKKGSRRRRTIGEFPNLSLKDARAKAVVWLARARGGVDPTRADEAEREAQRLAEERRQQDNLRVVAEQFRKTHLAQLRSGEAVWRALERTLLKAHGCRPISEITRRDLAATVDAVEGGYAQNRLTAHLKRFFGWTVEKGILETSPADHLKRPFEKEERRERVLDDRELRAFWKATEAGNVFDSAFRFLLTTATRRDETAAARAREINHAEALWTIPGERSKNKRAHTLPLSALALRVLAKTPRPEKTEYLFTTGGWAPISGWGKIKERLDAAMLAALREAAKERGEDPAAVELVPWRLHDLRRTAASGMAKLGTPRLVISKILNHTEPGGVTAVYDRHDYLPEMRRALDAWAAHIERVFSPRPALQAVS